MGRSARTSLPPLRRIGNVIDMPQQMPNRIREWRKAQGMTLDDLAERVGSTNQTLSRYETGKRNLTVDLMTQLAPALGCRPADLLLDGESVWDGQVHRLATAFQRLGPQERAVIERMIMAFAEQPEPVLRRKLG